MTKWSGVFLKGILDKLCFPSHLFSLIMNFVQSVSSQVLINSFPTRSFNSERGLRLGDALSSFLFAICVEGLIRSNSKAGNESLTERFKDGKSGVRDYSPLFRR